MRFPSKDSALRCLKDLGVEIGTVIDVGVQIETTELKNIFGDKKHILLEPVEEYHEGIKRAYEGFDTELLLVAASDKDGTSGIAKKFLGGGTWVTHSSLVEEGASEFVPTTRIDTLIRSRQDQRPFLLKIDVDGLEMEILRGSTGIIDDVDIVIIEATQSTFLERLTYLSNLGFKIWDIVDACYYHGVYMQSDIIMVSPRVMGILQNQPWQTAVFSWKDWVTIESYDPNQKRS